jgi:ubiquinone/menaquinone biosynthesis C-methylase UbiE
VPLERGALRTALRLANPGPGERLLDVATGTGALLRELAGSIPHGVRAVGLDVSPTMLAVASRSSDAGRLVEADAQELPFADATFDIVTVCYLLDLLAPTSRVQVLREVRRVVCPQGRVVLVTVDARHGVIRSLLGILPRLGWFTSGRAR